MAVPETVSIRASTNWPNLLPGWAKTVVIAPRYAARPIACLDAGIKQMLTARTSIQTLDCSKSIIPSNVVAATFLSILFHRLSLAKLSHISRVRSAAYRRPRWDADSPFNILLLYGESMRRHYLRNGWEALVGEELSRVKRKSCANNVTLILK